ncbi:hypothetical protein SAMN02910368_01393 [Lachnospiraceae bacterium G11]|nr:hypothetical protein SAMN02910368_01393 [Lachnospiraceae bacterium G11]
MKKIFDKDKLLPAGIATFLFFFMWLLFGPSEVFFANKTEFPFIYQDFVGGMAVFMIAFTIVVTFILALIPGKGHNIAVSLIFAFGVAGYIQVMFLNKGLDLLGVNPEGYKAETSTVVINSIVWVVIIVAVIALAIKKIDIWRKVVTYLSAFLILIQLVALASLVFTADKDAYNYPETEVHLSGADQFTVSSDENVIVLVLDYFSNQYLEPMEKAYPGSTDFLHDFTYYSNMDCVYFGTYPSLPHMLSGEPLDMSITVNEWTEQIWNGENCTYFYEGLKENGWKTNLYTSDTNILCGLNGVETLEGIIDNVNDEPLERIVSHRRLFSTLARMSGYRMFPQILKPYFYTNIDEYGKIVAVAEDGIQHFNYDFDNKLLADGLKIDSEKKYYIFQHLMGAHLRDTDENCAPKENASVEECTKGCMKLVEDYLNELKRVGAYDNSTIIITADHGGPIDSQVIFFIKEKNEQHDKLIETAAPVSFDEYMPTIAKACGLESEPLGQTIYDFAEGDSRQRTYWLRTFDPEHPAVMCYHGEKYGDSNSYYGYTYDGDINDLMEKILNDQVDEIILTPDSYF